MSADFRIGVDVMTTETTCLSSIWVTDDKIKEWYDIHGRSGDYKELKPADVAYYDGCVEIDLSQIKTYDRYAVPSEQHLHYRRAERQPHGHPRRL